MAKYADLHVHTFYSDSTFSPEEVVGRAKEANLAAIAICDHDSIDGISPCMEAAERAGIEVIPGIEMTVEKEDAEAHILGYFIGWEDPGFRKILKELQETRVERIHKMVEKLKSHGVDVDATDVLKLSGRGSVGRLHLAQAIMKTGKFNRHREIFDKFIGFGKPCYVPNIKLSPKGAIELLLKVGGIPVLAHPYTVGKDEYIEEFVGYGLKGIEIYHSDHTNSMTKRYKEIAERYNLLLTGGSDCHGLNKSRVLIGSVKVPYELVEKLKEEAEKINDK